MSNPIIPLDTPNPRIASVDPKTGKPARHIAYFFQNLVRRLGGQRADYIRDARAAAFETQAMTLAILRGISTGYYHVPVHPLSYTAVSDTLATINVAQHTRSTAAATIKAGSVSGLARDVTYFVYYDDAGNNGGAVTFHATTDVSILNAAGRRVVDAIYVEPSPPAPGIEG